MKQQSNRSYVPKEREPFAYTLWVGMGSLRVRAGLLKVSMVGEIEIVRYRKPEGVENWLYLARTADKLNAIASMEGSAA